MNRDITQGDGASIPDQASGQSPVQPNPTISAAFPWMNFQAMPGQPQPGIPMAAFGVQLRTQTALPYPPPEIIAGYKAIDPNLVERIFSRLDKESEFRHAEQEKEAEHRRSLEREGQEVQIKAMQEMQEAQIKGMDADRGIRRRIHDQSSLLFGLVFIVALVLGLAQGWQAVAAFLTGTSALTAIGLVWQGRSSSPTTPKVATPPNQPTGGTAPESSASPPAAS